MTLSAPCFLVACEDGELLRTVCRADTPRQQLKFKHLCKLLAYLTQVCGYDYPVVELQGATVVALKTAKFITMAVLMQPGPDTSAARLELQEFTAHLTQAYGAHQEMPSSDMCMHPHMTQRTVKCSQSSLNPVQPLHILNELDKQQTHCCLRHLQPLFTADGVTQVHLIELHPLKGLVTLHNSGSQSIIALSAEFEEGLHVACQLLLHYQSSQHSQGRNSQARKFTLATVKSQGTQCSLKALNMLEGSLFLMAFYSTELLPQAFNQKLHAAQHTLSAYRASESGCCWARQQYQFQSSIV